MTEGVFWRGSGGLMLRRFAFATAVLCVLGLGVLAGPALAGTVIGTTSGTPVACSGPFTAFEANEQAELIMQGYWLPSAVTDNVAGGDNIGAYHLVCNPPTGLAATSLSLDDGGDVVPDAVAADGTGYYPILG
jgi:hypothetical protein